MRARTIVSKWMLLNLRMGTIDGKRILQSCSGAWNPDFPRWWSTRRAMEDKFSGIGSDAAQLWPWVVSSPPAL